MKCAVRIGILLALCYAIASSVVLAAEHTKDSLEIVKKNLAAKKAVLVDVREKDEWDEGHLQNATLLPLSVIAAKASDNLLEKQFPKGAILYLHCASGRRVLPAADMLRKQGHDARPLREGYEALLEHGFPRSER